jgi:hypothetical protein
MIHRFHRLKADQSVQICEIYGRFLSSLRGL